MNNITTYEKAFNDAAIMIARSLKRLEYKDYTQADSNILKSSFGSYSQDRLNRDFIYIYHYKGYTIASTCVDSKLGGSNCYIEIYKNDALVRGNIWCASISWALVSAVKWIEADAMIESNKE